MATSGGEGGLWGGFRATYGASCVATFVSGY